MPISAQLSLAAAGVVAIALLVLLGWLTDRLLGLHARSWARRAGVRTDSRVRGHNHGHARERTDCRVLGHGDHSPALGSGVRRSNGEERADWHPGEEAQDTGDPSVRR